MPGNHQRSVDRLVDEVGGAVDLRVRAFILFGIPAHKDATGSSAWDDDGIVQQAIRSIKKSAPELVVMADTCLCEYTSHGHCGVVRDGEVINDESLELLGQLLVRRLQRGWLGFAFGKIDPHQHQVGPGVGLKLGLEEDLFAKLHAPAAPVRAAEVDEHEFAFRFRLSLSAGQIIQPGGRSVRRAIEKRPTYEPDQ